MVGGKIMRGSLAWRARKEIFVRPAESAIDAAAEFTNRWGGTPLRIQTTNYGVSIHANPAITALRPKQPPARVTAERNSGDSAVGRGKRGGGVRSLYSFGV